MPLSHLFNEFVQTIRAVKLGKPFADGDVVLEVLADHVEVGVGSLVAIAELGMGVKLTEKLKHLDRTHSHFRSEVGVRTTDDQDKILNDFCRVHVALKQDLLLLDQIEVLAHE